MNTDSEMSHNILANRIQTYIKKEYPPTQSWQGSKKEPMPGWARLGSNREGTSGVQ